MILTQLLFLESIGGGELMMIMLFVLLFFGSKKIPDLAKGLGKGMREFKDAMNGVQDELRHSIKDAENEVNKIKSELPELPNISSEPLAQPKNQVEVKTEEEHSKDQNLSA